MQSPAIMPQQLNRQRVLRSLVLAIGVSIIGTAGVTGSMIALAGLHVWWTGWSAALIVSALAAAVSLVPVGAGILAGPQWAAYGFLGGVAIRMFVAMLGCIAAVWVFRMPATPTLVLVVPLYFAQVAAEAWVLVRAFWPRG